MKNVLYFQNKRLGKREEIEIYNNFFSGWIEESEVPFLKDITCYWPIIYKLWAIQCFWHINICLKRIYSCIIIQQFRTPSVQVKSFNILFRKLLFRNWILQTIKMSVCFHLFGSSKKKKKTKNNPQTGGTNASFFYL